MGIEGGGQDPSVIRSVLEAAVPLGAAGKQELSTPGGGGHRAINTELPDFEALTNLLPQGGKSKAGELDLSDQGGKPGTEPEKTPDAAPEAGALMPVGEAAADQPVAAPMPEAPTVASAPTPVPEADDDAAAA